MKRPSVRWMGMTAILVGMAVTLRAAQQPLEIQATVAQPAVELGADIEYTVTVKNVSDVPQEIRELDFGRGFAELKVAVENEGEVLAFTYTRILGSVGQPRALQPKTLKPGEEVRQAIKLPAIYPGRTRLTGILWSRIELEPLTVDVRGAGKELRLVIETEKGTMEAELFPTLAPNTVANQVRLAKDGFFNGLTFHRIMKGFMIQGGCPKGDGSSDPGYSLPAEFNKRKHVRGILSMARLPDNNDSAGSQFFVMHGASPQLDNQYTVWGQLVDGLDTLDALANVKVGPSSRGEMSVPVKKPVIKTMRVKVVDGNGGEAANAP